MKYIIIISLLIYSCGKKEKTITNTISTPQSITYQTVIDQQNKYRQLLGQAPLTSGLVCNLYTVPNGTNQIIGASLTSVGSWLYNGTFNVTNSSASNGFPILPINLQSGYQSWFVTKCTGVIVILENNWYNFTLSSDDGANLYIDGLLINNDGLHGIQSKSTAKFLSYGTHSFQLDYLQANGMQALMLYQNGVIVNSQSFYH